MGYQQSVTYSAHGFRRALYFLMNMHGLYLFYPKCYMLIDWRVLYTMTTMPALEPKCSMPMNWRALLRYVSFFSRARYSVSTVTSMLALEPKCSIGLHCAVYVHRLGITPPPPPTSQMLPVDRLTCTFRCDRCTWAIAPPKCYVCSWTLRLAARKCSPSPVSLFLPGNYPTCYFPPVNALW